MKLQLFGRYSACPFLSPSLNICETSCATLCVTQGTGALLGTHALLPAGLSGVTLSWLQSQDGVSAALNTPTPAGTLTRSGSCLS